MTKNERPLVFLVGVLIDGTDREPVSPAAVVVERGIIVQAGPEESVSYDLKDCQVVEARENTLIPGLIDSHCHIFYLGVEEFDQSGVILIAQGIRNAGIWLRQGVTTARDVCTRDNLDVGLRDAINGGLVLGPRLFVSGEGMAMTGGKQKGHDLLVTEVTGPNEARRFVRQQLRAGVDLIKIFATAGLTEGGHAQLSVEEIRAAVEEAHRAGKRVASHAIGTEGIKDSIEAGVDTIEHGTFLDDEAVEMMVANSVALVPTLAIGQNIVDRGEEFGRPQALLENAGKALESARWGARKAYEAGVTIAAGTDPVMAETMAMECKLLLDIGLSPMEALQAATSVGAKILGIEDKMGTVEKGKWADLVILGGNPLEDISALEEVLYVVKDGAIVKSPEQ